MTAPWQKAIRDFWQERTRSLLVVLAIAIGIAAFASVLASFAILTRELNRGYLATNPASATLYTDAIDDELVAAILANPAVSDAEPRRTVQGRFKVGPAVWRTLVLFVVKDYGDIRVSRLEPQQGAWPPATGEILIERDAMQVAKARVGDRVTIRTNGGKEQTLRLTGTVKDVGQAQARMENIVYGYITLATLAQLGEEPYLNQLKILVAENRFDEALNLLTLNEETHPQSPAVPFTRGNILMARNDTTGAIAAFRAALQRDSAFEPARAALRSLGRLP